MALNKSGWISLATGAALLATQACATEQDTMSLPTTGGIAATTGGILATGGIATTTGGIPATGGALSTGGLEGTGGESMATGGVSAATGGAEMGTGGAEVGTGGMMTGGTDVSPVGDILKSAGCGIQDPGDSGTFTIDVDGTRREYIVKVPTNYDVNEAYRLVYAWHYMGGTAAGIAGGRGGGFYGLESRANGSTIFVAGQGLSSGGDTGWYNSGGQDVAFAKAMHTWMTDNYCVNQTKVFSTGMSFGGIMSNTVGCAMGDVFRAIAPIAGSGPRNFRGSTCTGQVAAWITHGNQDTVVSYPSGQASRDHWRSANHCDTASTSVAPDDCVSYDGCDDGYPVHWCEWTGGHRTPSFAADGIWNFFSQF